MKLNNIKKCNCYSFDLDCDIMLTMIAAYSANAKKKIKKNLYAYVADRATCVHNVVKSMFFMGN